MQDQLEKDDEELTKNWLAYFGNNTLTYVKLFSPLYYPKVQLLTKMCQVPHISDNWESTVTYIL